MYPPIITDDSVNKKMDKAEKKLLVFEGNKKEIIRGIGLFWLVSTVFLFLRIFLEALGSDPQAGFAMFIYFVSSIFLLPFYKIFPNHNETIQPGTSTFDSQALTAIFCYSILVGLAIGVTHIVTRMLKTGKQVDETVDKDNLVDPTESEQVVK